MMEQKNRLTDERPDRLDLLTVLSGTTSFIFLVDRHLRIRFASPSAAMYFGMVSEAMEGRRFQDLPLPEGVARDYEEVVLRAFENDAPQEAKSSFALPSGRAHFAYDAVPVRGLEGAVEVVLTARDITASKSGEILGEVLNRIYGTISSTMSTPEIMKRVIDISASALDSDALAVIMPEKGRWMARYVHDAPSSKLAGIAMDEAEIRRAFLAPDEVPAAVEDVRQAAWVDQEVMARLRIMSFISVPFKVRSAVTGLLTISFARPRRITPEEVDFSGKLATAVSQALENSELYHQEMELRYLVQALLDDVPAVIMAVDGQDQRVKWSNRYSDRYRPEELRGLSTTGLCLGPIVPGFEEAGIADIFRKVAMNGRPFYASEFMVTGLGPETTYWNGSVVPLRQSGSNIPDLLIMAVDVTEQVRARKMAGESSHKVQEERARLHAMLATLPVGVAIVGRSGRVTDLNEAGEKLWASVLPSFSDLKDLADVQAWSFESGEPMRLDDWGMVKAAFSGIATDNEMVTIARYDGRKMVIMMSSTPLRDASAGVIGAVVVGQDLTNQLQVRRELVESKERAEMFVDLLTHDVSNLNAAAMGYLQLLQSAESLGKKERGWTVGSLQALEECSRLIESIRGLQDIESGREALAIVDLDRVLREVIGGLVPHPSREIDVRLSSRGNHCVLASPLVKELFSNLLDNSIKHSEGPLTVWINVRSIYETGREYHRVEIDDDGPGIQDRMKENVFSRTWRGRTKGVGKGLGLFLVRRLAESLEGQVWVEDRVSGRADMGARFVVLLPAADCARGKERDG